MPLGLPKLSSDPVLFLPLWLGTLRDAVNGNVGTPHASTYWNTHGDADRLFCTTNYMATFAAPAESDYRISGPCTFFVSGDFVPETGTRELFSKRDGGGSNYQFLITATGLSVTDSTAAASAWNPGAATLAGAKSWAAVVRSPGTVDYYKNGVYAGTGVGSITMVADDATLAIGGLSHVGTLSIDSPLSSVAIYPGNLSAPEIAQLHTYSQSRFTPRKQWPGGGLRYPDRGDPYTPATGDLMFGDNFQTARVTLADEAGPSAQFSNTGFSIASGTFSLREDDTGRYAFCVGAGTLRRGLLDADTFTTDLFTESGGATIAKDSTGFDLIFGAGDIVRAVRLTAP